MKKKIGLLVLLLVAAFSFQSCTENDEVLPIEANFETSVDVDGNQAMVRLTNTSQDATSYQWTFPNGNPESSTEESPIVTYIENGDYTITLEASNGTEIDTKTFEFTVSGLNGGNGGSSDCIKGEGDIVTRILSVADFASIDLATVPNVTIKRPT